MADNKITITSPKGETRNIYESQLGGFTKSGWSVSPNATVSAMKNPTMTGIEQKAYDFAHQPITVPNQLNATDFSNISDLTIPDTSYQQYNNNLASNNLINAGLSTNDFYNNLLKQQSVSTANTENTSLYNQMKKALEATKDKSADLLAEQEALGIPQATQQLQDINLQIAQLTKGYDQAITNLQGGTGLTTTIAGKQGLVSRQKAVEVGGLATVAQALQGNITLAKQTAKDTIDLKYADAEQKIENIQTLLDLNKENMTLEQQKKATVLELQLKARQEEIDKQKTTETQISDLAIKVLENTGNTEKAKLVLDSKNYKEAIYNAGESLTQFAEDKLLSPTEASTLGVPYGTTQKQAAAMGVVPNAVLTPEDKIKQEFSMSKQLDTALKETNNARRQIGIMEAGYNEAVQAGLDGTSNNAPSQAVLVTFQKLLDPTSVVRESEYARSGAGQSLVQRTQGTYEKLLRGGAGVTQAELKNFYDLSQQLLQGYNDEQINILKRTRTQAENWGLNLNNVITPEAEKLLIQDDAKRLKEYYNSVSDEERDKIDSIINDYNGEISDYDILKIVGQGFNQDLSKSLKGTFAEGSYGGQCTTFLHKIADFPSIGDSKSEKFASVDKIGIKKENWTPKVGDIIVTNESQKYGHTAMVTKILPTGELVLTESNYSKPNTITHNRTLAYNSPVIYGAIRPNNITV